MEKLKKYILSAITGLDAIKKASIVNYKTNLRCLRIGDISQNKKIFEWGYTNALFDKVKQFLIKKDDIFIARTGTSIGCSFFADKNLNSVFNNGIIRLRTNNVLIPKFLFYFIQTKIFKDYIYNIGIASSTQPNIKIIDILNYNVNVPDLPIQQHIVNTILLFHLFF
ncbi:restriction endonuclease subunit S [Mycoplasma elephantis]|uniref:restriction endonuclease subunit S n=1 Tax=Mycoplasma elephantis TaxID=114882 RepID=UPI00047F7F02|nr:restriction endonuclease subunit S [Mycoplasma elephantis]